MKISEVGQGGGGGPDYVELQMYADGQNLVGGKFIRTYDSDGMVQGTFEFPDDVASGESQRTVLVARSDGALSGVEPDFITPDLVLTGEGAVCFGESFALNAAVDCVGYGATFGGIAGDDPSPTGSPAPAPDSGEAIHRTIAPGCATLLEASDDSDDSATDFAVAAPSPRNNATAPTETPCADTAPPETTIDKGPKKRTEKRKAKFRFSSSEAGSSFQCKLDRKPFKRCDSPFRKKVKAGKKHKFRVRAIDAAGNVDPTPAKRKWKVRR